MSKIAQIEDYNFKITKDGTTKILSDKVRIKIIDAYTKRLTHVNIVENNSVYRIDFTKKQPKPNQYLLLAFMNPNIDENQYVVDTWYDTLNTRALYPYTLKEYNNFINMFNDNIPKQTKIIELVRAKNPDYIIHPIFIIDSIPLIFNVTNPTGDILTKLKSIYSKNRWVSSYSTSTYIYIMNTNDDIISVVSINNNTNELRDDMTDPVYERLGLYKILCNERVKYATRNFNFNTIYNLYTEHDYLIPMHCNSGLYLASNTKQRIPGDSDPTLYWHFTTFMTDENILNRLREEHIMDSIIRIRDCVATSIGNNNIISAMHCSERPGANDHNYDMMTDVRNEYFIQNICSDGNINNSDIVIYEKNDIPHQVLTPLIWNPRDTMVFFNNMCIRFIVFNKYSNEFIILDTYNNIPNIEFGGENECHTITFNFGPKLPQGNSGGPLIIYIGNRFYIIGVLSDGSNAFKLYSLFCSLFNKNTLNMYSSFNFNRSGYSFRDIIRDDIKDQIYNNFIRFTVNDRKIMIP
jgi:hypothetical protein